MPPQKDDNILLIALLLHVRAVHDNDRFVIDWPESKRERKQTTLSLRVCVWVCVFARGVCLACLSVCSTIYPWHWRRLLYIYRFMRFTDRRVRVRYYPCLWISSRIFDALSLFRIVIQGDHLIMRHRISHVRPENLMFYSSMTHITIQYNIYLFSYASST